MDTSPSERRGLTQDQWDNVPPLVSVDDHVLEPPTLWADRLPSKYQDVGPRVIREKYSATGSLEKRWGDVWYYEDAKVAQLPGAAAAGLPPVADNDEPILYEDLRPGCYQLGPRLEDMDTDGVEASLCFPNIFVRFCGQRFLWAKDKELALLCVKAYNDWLIEEWCKPSGGRLLGSAIIPLWDVDLAAQEVRRNAARGCTSMCFSEVPARLGLPSMYSGYWDPLFSACNDTGTVINVHIGSSSLVWTTSDDAPAGIKIVNNFSNSAFSMSDWLTCGAFVRFPELRVAMSEGQAGWIPYVLSRLDATWRTGAGFVGFTSLPEPPSSYFPGHIFACVFDDPAAARFLDVIGEDNLCFEADYPHNDGSWPYSRVNAHRLTADMTVSQREKVLRLNGARLYGIQRVLDDVAQLHSGAAQ